MIARLELLRLWRSRRLALAGASLALFLFLMLLGFYTYAQTETGGDAEFRYTFENASYFNGLTFALYAFYFAFLLLLPVFAATEAGVHMAGDRAAGTEALLLGRPLTRGRLFFTKLAVAGATSSLLVGAFLAAAMALGLVSVGWGDLDLYPGVLQMTDVHQHLPQAEALQRFLLAWPAASLALAAPLAFSCWVSVWARSPVDAVGLSVALYLVLYVIAEVHFFRDLRPFLFTTHLAYWRELFREEIAWGALARDAARLAGFTFLFLALAFRRYRRRELA